MMNNEQKKIRRQDQLLYVMRKYLKGDITLKYLIEVIKEIEEWYNSDDNYDI